MKRPKVIRRRYTRKAWRKKEERFLGLFDMGKFVSDQNERGNTYLENLLSKCKAMKQETEQLFKVEVVKHLEKDQSELHSPERPIDYMDRMSAQFLLNNSLSNVLNEQSKIIELGKGLYFKEDEFKAKFDFENRHLKQ